MPKSVPSGNVHPTTDFSKIADDLDGVLCVLNSGADRKQVAGYVKRNAIYVNNGPELGAVLVAYNAAVRIGEPTDVVDRLRIACELLGRLAAQRPVESAVDSLRTLVSYFRKDAQTMDKTPELSEPDTPSRWGRRFGFSAKTFLRRVKDGKIRVKKLSDRSYQVHVDDLPKPPSGHK